MANLVIRSLAVYLVLPGDPLEVRITRKTDNLGFVVQLDRRVFFDALNEVV